MGAGDPAARVAVFDLDGTLSRGDLYLAFLAACLRRLGPARPLRLAGLPWATLRHLVGAESNASLKAAWLDAVLGGRTRMEAEAVAAGFAARAAERAMKPAALEQVAGHRKAGDRLVLASASLDIYVAPIARLLGFEVAVATRVAWTPDGRIAGTLDGPNLRGPAKLDAVRAALGLEGAALLPPLVAYSDHESDAALLGAATEAVAVDPTPAMAVLAARCGWQVVHWGRHPAKRDAAGVPGAPRAAPH